MGKMKPKIAPSKPLTLRLSLAAPGMGPLHRAGLGGLAATLAALERAHRSDRIKTAALPSNGRGDGAYPWTVDETSITLDFGAPGNAAAYLQKLFAFAFDKTPDGLIFLPGQHDGSADDAVLAELQRALTLTFIQHGKTRKLEKEARTFTKDAGDNKPIRYDFKPCSWFKHQNGWEDLVDGDELTNKPGEVVGPLNPGAVVRHVAFTGDTRIEETPERLLPLYFAVVGCVALSANRGTGVLLVPEVTDLKAFASYRPAMTPRLPKECQIASASDAALQAQLRLRAKGLATKSIPAVYAMGFRSTPWASQQKSRVMSVTVPAGDDRRLQRFEDALDYLPTRVAQKTEKISTGRGKQKQTIETVTYFWAASLVRPLAADNLARDKPWYLGFAKLMTGLERNKLGFEREGLINMTNDDDLYDDAGEQAIMRCIHGAMRSRYGQISEENKGNANAMKNRFAKEYERWRLAFAGSKTPDQFRTSFADLVSRGGPGNKAIQQAWGQILPYLRKDRWQQARDLSLLALASYESTSAKQSTEKEKE
jgi:CRISPR-associated protein Cas8a1/Csx13